MTSEQSLEQLPLSYINQYDYCARRFWYMYVEGEMVENVHVLRGKLQHETIDTPGYQSTDQDVVAHRRVHVYSRQLGITGICDLVEEHADGRLTPVEYKQGRQGKWDNDRAQLCAQALCLEEMADPPGSRLIDHGYLWYFGSRRRVRVEFTAELRSYTRHLVRAMQQTVALGTIPPHTAQRARCNGCSLVDICLPEETQLLNGQPVTSNQ
jgi:CRISPR-associated exonuclease Cas4